MTKRVAVCIVGIMVMVGLAGGADAQSLQGTWQVESARGGKNAAGKMLPDAVDPHGLVIITDTHYAWVFYAGDHAREVLPPLKTPGRPTQAELLAFAQHMGGFAASTGTYTLSGTTFSGRPVIQQVKGPNGYEFAPLTIHFDGDDTVTFTAQNGRVYTLTRVK